MAETKLNETHPTAEFSIEAYQKTFRRGKSRHSEGLLLYVYKNIVN